ncbi:MAG: phosphotransferase family protein [Dehalococcoidia bacterium]
MTLTAALPRSDAVQAWLRGVPRFEAASVRSITAADGGVSNITCCVELEGAPFAAIALRLQRTRGIFEPYDVLREGQVIRCLNASDLPVPRFIASEPDVAALGAPFIAMEWIDAPHMGLAGPEGDFGAFTLAVAAVHSVDWRALGLGEVLGVPASAAVGIRGELNAVAARMPAFGCDTDSLLCRALEALLSNVPRDGAIGLCQGDINIFNYLFRRGEVVGIVDWEQARISDPRSDIGQLLALSHLKGAPWGPAEAMPFAQMYGAAAGRQLTNMSYFRALWLFELGVIYHGWMAFNDSEPWFSWSQIEKMLTAALDEIG